MTTTAVLPTLDPALLDRLRGLDESPVALPAGEMLTLPERAVQFGTGAFLRGFVDDFLHRANERGSFAGRVVVVGSTSGARDAAINAQRGLYTLVVQGLVDGEPVQECRIIGAVSRALSAADEWDEVLALARTPALRFAFSNTTEVGIALDERDRFDDAPPRSFPAKLTRFLYERAKTCDYDPAAGMMIIPCELIDDNGARLRELVHTLASTWSLGERFTRWLAESVTFCNTLVDRIVPGTPRGDEAQQLTALLGYDDALLTACEPYRLFAIEGDERLRAELSWASDDPTVIIAPDISPYRERKVRLLNGAHTLMVSAALEMGFATVRDAIADPALHALVQHAMLDEIVPTLDVDGAPEFAAAVLERFANPYIRHALVDITLHGTAKMRVRVVPSVVRYASRMGTAPRSLTFGFAAFLWYMRGDIVDTRRASNLPVPTDDHAERLRTLWSELPDDGAAALQRLTRAVCSDASLWGTDLGAVPGFADAVSTHLGRIRELGVRGALERHLDAVRT